jgi:hypothetical protein
VRPYLDKKGAGGMVQSLGLEFKSQYCKKKKKKEGGRDRKDCRRDTCGCLVCSWKLPSLYL